MIGLLHNPIVYIILMRLPIIRRLINMSALNHQRRIDWRRRQKHRNDSVGIAFFLNRLEILNNMPQSEAAFQVAKDAAIKQIASQRTTKFSVLNAYVNAQRLGLDYDLNEKIYNSLPSLRLQDIVDFEKHNMANKPYRYIILGDEKELDIKAFEQIAPIRRLTLEEVFGY